MIEIIKINDNKDFLTLFKRGKFISDKFAVLYYRKNGKRFNRLGITTGKKVGNAVIRSRCRRIIRAAYAKNCENFPIGYDIVIVARKETQLAKSDDISKFLSKRAIPAMFKYGK